MINLKNLQNHKTQTKKKPLTFENANRLLKGRQKVLNGFKIKIFPTRKQTQGKGHPLDLAKQLKILTPKQMLQRLPIALALVKQVTHLKTY